MKKVPVILLVLALVGLGAFSVAQQMQLRTLQQSLSEGTSATEKQEAPVAKSEVPVPDTGKDRTTCASRARVKEKYELNPNGSVRFSFQTVSVDGKEFAASTVTNGQDGRIDQAIVSLDCLRVAWVVTPAVAINDETGMQVKPSLVRTVALAGGSVQEVVLPAVGPAALHPFVGTDAIVSVATPEVREVDVPSEADLEGAFYRVDLASGRTENIGGPYLAVSPDFRFVVRRIDGTISLQTKEGGSTVVLADRKKNEFATDFAFSPDSRYLAYLRLKGEDSLLFAKLYRPINPEIIDEIVRGDLLVRDVSGPDAGRERPIISGGYTVDSFRVDRWTSATEIEWTQPETASRLNRTDVTNGGSSEKNGLLDQEAI